MKIIWRVLWIMVMCGGVPASLWAETPNKDGKGDVIITIFSDFYSGFGSVNHERGFDLDRAYLGYRYRFTDGLEIKAVMDFGRSRQVEDHHRIGFIKNAQVTWKHNQWELNGGLISTTQFKVQEDFWGKRYIMKSFQDEYKFGSSADLGFSVAYDFSEKLGLDFIVANGEGYKKIQVDRGLQYGAGLTWLPCTGVMVRMYGSYNEASQDGQKGITNLAGFIGYQNKSLSVGGEYNYQLNTDYLKGQVSSGTSLYATYFTKSGKINLFGRWDVLMSNGSWNIGQDGMNALCGAEFCLGKYVKLAPNVRVWFPESSGLKNQCYLYLNASFVL